jgi:phage-related protein
MSFGGHVDAMNKRIEANIALKKQRKMRTEKVRKFFQKLPRSSPKTILSSKKQDEKYRQILREKIQIQNIEEKRLQITIELIILILFSAGFIYLLKHFVL